MDWKGKATKTEKFLLALTAVFLCFVTVLAFRDRTQTRSGSWTVTAAQGSAPEKIALVNLNTATQEELTALPGIGDTLAERIISYREAHGGFSSAEEVRQVEGIGEGKYAGIENLITVEDGDT